MTTSVCIGFCLKVWTDYYCTPIYTHYWEFMKLVRKLVATLPCVIHDEGDGLTLSPTSSSHIVMRITHLPLHLKNLMKSCVQEIQCTRRNALSSHLFSQIFESKLVESIQLFLPSRNLKIMISIASKSRAFLLGT